MSTELMNLNRYAIILCGGSGTRLWPLSRSLKPKHLLPLTGDSPLTLLQQTAKRVCRKVAASNVVTVTHETHRFEVKGQLSDISPDALAGVIAEPVAKNTLAAIAVGVRRIHAIDPTSIIGVFPSDHTIENEKAFIEAWSAAEASAEAGFLTLLGIKPTEASTGYGYIKPGLSLDLDEASLEITSVASFVEKPDREKAERFVSQGCLWNSGMFVFRADVFMDMLERYQPDFAAIILNMTDDNIVAEYEKLPVLSMDHGIVELANNVAVVSVDMAWSDLGNWESIYQHHPKGASNNVVRGEVVTLDTADSLLWSETGVLTTVGLDNVIVIQTADATLVCDRDRVEDVKLVVNEIRCRYPSMAETHLTVHRPWGSYSVLEEALNFKIKRIVVSPGRKLSLQSHQGRSEHWVVVCGTASVRNGDQDIVVQTNESTYIPAGCMHRLGNDTDKELVVIEVQTGELLSEADIVRYEDDYGRMN
jgi:mannose-1-phosphate guanylyltransferase / mannose-6-phosphate isomerase